jgi:hypothetical protein
MPMIRGLAGNGHSDTSDGEPRENCDYADPPDGGEGGCPKPGWYQVGFGAIGALGAVMPIIRGSQISWILPTSSDE